MVEMAERPEATVDRARDVARRIFRHENAVLVIVLIGLMGIMSAVTGGLSTRVDNLLNILLQSSVRGVVSIGQAFVILTAGIDLSVSGIAIFSAFMVSAMTTAETAHSFPTYHYPAYAGVALALLAGASWGVLSGSFVSRIGVPALIVTLGMWEITKGVTWQISKADQIGHLPESLSIIGQGRVAGVPVSFIIFISLAVVAYLVLMYTRFGRSVYAVGGNPVSAWLSGISVKRTIFSVYVISAFCAALGGVIFTGRVMRWSQLSLKGLELDSIGSVCVGGVSLFGGRGTMIGVIIGVFIISVINNAMSILKADPMLQGIVKGAVIFTAVAIDSLRRRR